MLAAADNLAPTTNSPLLPAVMRLATIILYTAGLRRGELARLTLDDVEPQSGLLRIERLMRENGLRARPRRRGLPKDTGERAAVSDNLLDRAFEASAPNQKWVADFTYVWTAEGWLYVAAVVDLFSRRLVGWAMKAEMTAQLVTDALIMAIWRRGKPDSLLHHSDQGSQIQAVVAAPIVFTHDSNWSSASAGVFQPKVFLGRALRAAATAAISSALWTFRSVPFGKYGTVRIPCAGGLLNIMPPLP